MHIRLQSNCNRNRNGFRFQKPVLTSQKPKNRIQRKLYIHAVVYYRLLMHTTLGKATSQAASIEIAFILIHSFILDLIQSSLYCLLFLLYIEKRFKINVLNLKLQVVTLGERATGVQCECVDQYPSFPNENRSVWKPAVPLEVLSWKTQAVVTFDCEQVRCRSLIGLLSTRETNKCIKLPTSLLHPLTLKSLRSSLQQKPISPV